MRARVPQDVDLEDRLIYGLSPLRFGYLVIAALGSLSLWRVEAMPPWLRAVPCLLLVAAAAALAWGRWQGRSLDRWLVDLAVFAGRNFRLSLTGRPGRHELIVPLHAIAAIAPRRDLDAAAEERAA